MESPTAPTTTIAQNNFGVAQNNYGVDHNNFGVDENIFGLSKKNNDKEQNSSIMIGKKTSTSILMFLLI